MRFTARLFLTALFCFAMDAVTPEAGRGARRRRDDIPFRHGYRYLGGDHPGASVVVKNIGDGNTIRRHQQRGRLFQRPSPRSRHVLRDGDVDGVQDRCPQ